MSPSSEMKLNKYVYVVMFLLCALIEVESASKLNGTTPITPQPSTSTTESYPKYEKIPKIVLPIARSFMIKKNSTTSAAQQQREAITGNELWDGVIYDCLNKPSMSCIQKNVYGYLDDTLGLHDVNFTNRFIFKKNQVDFSKYSKEVNEDDNEIPDSEARSGNFKHLLLLLLYIQSVSISLSMFLLYVKRSIGGNIASIE